MEIQIMPVCLPYPAVSLQAELGGRKQGGALAVGLQVKFLRREVLGASKPWPFQYHKQCPFLTRLW